MPLNVFLTLLCAMAAGYLLYRLKVPGGMMVGAVLGAMLLNITTGRAAVPSYAKIISQVIAGAYIGSGVSKQEVKEMRHIAKPAIILIPCLLVINLSCGLLMHHLGGVDLLSALFSCAPGGISDIPIIASDAGADPSVVTVLQFVRFLMGIVLFPSLIHLLGRHFDPQPAQAETIKTPKAAKAKKQILWSSVAITLSVAFVAGYAGKLLHIPGGIMALATIATIGLKWFYPQAGIYPRLRQLAQLLAGAYVGSRIGPDQLMALGNLWKSAVILIVCYSVGGYLIAYLLRKAHIFSYRESLLAATPAGASDMALIAADLGVNNARLIVLQVLRLILVLSLFPTIIVFFAKMF